MWVNSSPDTTSHANNSETMTDNSRNYINTTYFEESTEVTRQRAKSYLIQLDSHGNTQKTRDLIELDGLVKCASSSSLPVSSSPPHDSGFARSTSTLLATSEPSIFPDLTAVCPSVESKETQQYTDHIYIPLISKEVEGECQAPDSDVESYFTCEDDASETEENTSVKGKINFSPKVSRHLNDLDNVNWIIV